MNLILSFLPCGLNVYRKYLYFKSGYVNTSAVREVKYKKLFIVKEKISAGLLQCRTRKVLVVLLALVRVDLDKQELVACNSVLGEC